MIGAAARLSQQEKAILAAMLGLKRAGYCEPYWGVRLRWLRRAPTRSQAASLSRSLRRLEARGLVQRRNQSSASPRRSTHVAFSAAGEAVAETLAEAETPNG